MDAESSFPHVVARYRPHPIDRYRSNPFISALPPFPDHKTLRKRLTVLPEHHDDQRVHDASLRIVLLKQLSRFMLGLPRVAELAQSVNASILEGYVGREPHSAAVNRHLQTLYEAESVEQLGSYGLRNTSQFSSALVGTPGSGKSFSLAQIAALYPPIIRHKEHNVWQIPVLQIEMAYNGVSVGTLAHAILTELDSRFPQGNYRRLYLDVKANAEQKLLSALSLTHIHAVGVLHVDEAQNQRHSLDNTEPGEKRLAPLRVFGQTPLTTLLVTASNRLQLPLLLSGTAELRHVLGRRMSLLRRMVGAGLRPWGPLSVTATDAQVSEFDIFMALMWRFQWTKSPRPLTRSIRNLFHFYTFGIPDVMVKLYHDVQWRAIQRGGDEVIDQALIHDVAANELGALTQVTAAMRLKDSKALAKLSTMSDLAAEFDIRPGELMFLPSNSIVGSNPVADHADVPPSESAAEPDAGDDTSPPVFDAETSLSAEGDNKASSPGLDDAASTDDVVDPLEPVPLANLYEPL